MSSLTDLEKGLLELKNISYDSIDKLMRKVAKKNKISATELHHKFKNKHNMIPDDWIKKQVQESWSNKYKKSIDCDNPKGFSQRAHCQGKKKKVTEDLRKWFGTGGEGGIGGGGWDEYNTKGERTGKCARGENDDGKGPKPKCLSKEKASKMSKSEIAAAVKRKRRQDPVADRPGKGGKPKMVSNKIDEGLFGRKKVKPGTTNATYAGMTQNEIRKQNQQNKLNKKTTGDVNSGTYDDPWLRNAPHGEKKHHYRQLRGEEMSLSRMSEAKKQPDHEHSMIRSELETIKKAVDRLKSKMKGEGNVEAWVQSKITKAADYIDSAADYIESGEHNVHGSMDEEKNPCWKGYKQVGMKKKDGKEVPNCVPEEVSPIVSRVLDKHFATEELQTFEEENKPTNPKLWSRAKSLAKKKFDVYPSAYANGWAAKWYKSKGGKWKTSEEVELQEKENVNEWARIPSQNGNIYMVAFSWRGKMMYLKVFFPSSKRPTRKQVEETINKVYPGAIIRSYDMTIVNQGDSYLNAGSYEGGSGAGKKTNVYAVFDEDWQKVNKSDKTDGMSQKAVNAYRRENPGSKLKTAVTEKNPGPKRSKRRKSFCARSKGQQDMHNIDCSKTPDKAICKARRRWRC